MKYLISLIILGGLSIAASAQHITSTNWHRRSSTEIYGSNSDSTYASLLRSNKKANDVIVALIVDGIDTTNARINGSLLKASDKMLKKSKKAKMFGKNSFFGWNFLGSSNGEINISSLGTESFRIFQDLHIKYKDVDANTLTTEIQKNEYEDYLSKKQENRIDSYLKFFDILSLYNHGAVILDSIVTSRFGKTDIAITQLSGLDFSNVNPDYERCLEAIYGECQKGVMKGMTSWKEVSDNAKNDYNVALERINSLSIPKSNPRYTLGDDIINYSDLSYGNTNIMCDKYDIGTALASIISATKVAHDDVIGIYPAAKILPIRAYAVGDAFDKDIYQSIYFAVDNGAKVIILSTPKPISTGSDKIEEALRYAQKMDVVVVIAAGDKGKDLNKIPFYPLAVDDKNITLNNVIRVGASTIDGTKSKTTNFGEGKVDIYAPGENVSAIFGSDVAAVVGSSVSAAIVGGVVSMIRAYNPKLSAAQIKEMIIKSGRAKDDIIIIDALNTLQ